LKPKVTQIVGSKKGSKTTPNLFFKKPEPKPSPNFEGKKKEKEKPKPELNQNRLGALK
jgi:hypothetical protein